MPSAKLTSPASLWYLVLFAVLPLGSSQTTCSEVGCTCDDAHRIVSCVGLNLSFVPLVSATGLHSINLSANQIREVSNDDFVRFAELRYLDLSYNLLVNISANAFSRNVHLHRLVLDGNDLNAGDVLAAGKVPLRELYLSANRIGDLDEFTVFSSLSTLDLSGNELVSVPETFLDGFAMLRRLNLAGNWIGEFAVNVSSVGSSLRELNLSSNSITRFSISGELSNLEVLDLSWNQLFTVDSNLTSSFPNLLILVVSGNPIGVFPDFAFQYLNILRSIEMNSLQNLTSISDNAFSGLHALRSLHLAHNSRLNWISDLALANLTQLTDIDLSDNNLTFINSTMFVAQTRLVTLDISLNPWSCDCLLFAEFLALQNLFRNSSCALNLGSVCWDLDEVSATNQIENLTVSGRLDCRKPRVVGHAKNMRARLGSSVVLDCNISGHPRPQVVWVTNRNLLITYPVLVTISFISDVNTYVQQFEKHNRMFILKNGSLYIAYVTRKEGGTYKCIATNEHGNNTVYVKLQLDYEIMTTVTVTSIIVGFLTAASFFCIAVVIGAVRYLTFVCSSKERKKRKSIREVLETIQDYKSAQFDKLTAYKTAKMDQLSAFKSAKIDQFSAFRHSRIGKLRTYKQATVTSVLQYLERMREHYTNQTVRIKDNCAQQMEKLRESYGVQRGKFKDYRSHQVEKMRDNYNAQVLKIRDYGIQQMSKLREQYKSQQQNMLKLLELLDVGNCVTVIEAECIHTESLIFDASIAFDFEAHPIHVPRDSDSTISGESHYLTASESGSESDLANPNSISFAADVEPGLTESQTFPDFPAMDFDDSSSDIFLESFPIEPMEFPEMPEIPGFVIAGTSRDHFAATSKSSERETEC